MNNRKIEIQEVKAQGIKAWSKNTRDKSKLKQRIKSKSLFTIENDRKDIVEKLEEFRKKL